MHNYLPTKRLGSPTQEKINEYKDFKKVSQKFLTLILMFHSHLNKLVNGKFSEGQLDAINDELKNLYGNSIITFVNKLPKIEKAIKTKSIFTIKRDSNNNIIKFKARLVAKGFVQKRGIEYELTFSPILSIDNIKLIISLAAKFNWNISQLNY